MHVCCSVNYILYFIYKQYLTAPFKKCSELHSEVAQPPYSNSLLEQPQTNWRSCMASAGAPNPWEDHKRTPDLASMGDPSSGSEEDDEFIYPDAGDYSTQMEDLFGEDDGGLAGEEHKSDDSNEEEEGFFYSGVDAETSVGYNEQLRDVLGQDEDDEEEVNEVEHSLVQVSGETSVEEDELLVCFFFVLLFCICERFNCPHSTLTMKHCLNCCLTGLEDCPRTRAYHRQVQNSTLSNLQNLFYTQPFLDCVLSPHKGQERNLTMTLPLCINVHLAACHPLCLISLHYLGNHQCQIYL